MSEAITEVQAKQWAVVCGKYKANPKQFTKRDGLRKAQLEIAIMNSHDPSDTDSSLEMLHLNNFYPLLKYGIADAEGFDLPLSEETFWELPEQFVFDLSEVIQEENPQYAIPFSALHAEMWKSYQTPSVPQPDNTSTNDKTDKTT